MEEKDRRALEQVLADHLDEELLQLLLSDPRDKEKHQKVKVRPLLLKGQLVFQMEEFIGKQVFHKNLSAGEAAAALTALLREDFGRCEIWSEKGWAQALVSRKGKVTVKRKPKARRAGAGERGGGRDPPDSRRSAGVRAGKVQDGPRSSGRRRAGVRTGKARDSPRSSGRRRAGVRAGKAQDGPRSSGGRCAGVRGRKDQGQIGRSHAAGGDATDRIAAAGGTAGAQ